MSNRAVSISSLYCIFNLLIEKSSFYNCINIGTSIYELGIGAIYFGSSGDAVLSKICGIKSAAVNNSEGTFCLMAVDRKPYRNQMLDSSVSECGIENDKTASPIDIKFGKQTISNVNSSCNILRAISGLFIYSINDVAYVKFCSFSNNSNTEYRNDNSIVGIQLEHSYNIFMIACNFNDNPMCASAVLLIAYCEDANISYSNFFGNNATILIYAWSSNVYVNNCYTDSLTEISGTVEFEDKQVLRNFQNVTILDHGICNHKQICENHTCDVPYYIYSAKPLLGLFIINN